MLYPMGTEAGFMDDWDDMEDGRMPTLEEIAEMGAYALSDDWQPGELEEFMAKSPAERVSHFYCMSDCGVFAVALQKVTGWPIRSLGNDEHGRIHSVVEAPDGRLLDASGWQTLRSLRKRHAAKDATLSEPGGVENAMGYFENKYEGLDGSLRFAVSAIRQLPWAPFDDPEFRAVSERQIEGIDRPYGDYDPKVVKLLPF